jgi:DNA invertase Pin-like site-specific DNA recombinase
MKLNRKGRIKVVAYCRTSSAANVGSDKDSEKRQRTAIESFAKRAGLQIVDWFYDPVSFAQYEKARLVTKLRGARERIREASGKCEGRKSYAERDPDLVLTAKRLHRRSPKGHRRSLREIASELATMGYTNKRGAPYSASCVKSMVEGPSP